MLLVKRLGPSSGDKRYINAIDIAIVIASLSAASFPWIPTGPGIHQRVN